MVGCTPPLKNFVVNSDIFMVKLPGGAKRSAIPPSVFGASASCLPSPRAPPRPRKKEGTQLEHFKNKDKTTSFGVLSSDKKLKKLYKNILISRASDKFVYVFMSSGFEGSKLTVMVENQPIL